MRNKILKGITVSIFALAPVIVDKPVYANTGTISTLATDEVELFPNLSRDTTFSNRQTDALGNQFSNLGQAGSAQKFFIRIKQVRTISGNNPFDRREPLLNFNGERVTSLSELVSLINTGTSSSLALSECEGLATFTDRTGGLFTANMDIDGSSLNCNTAPPGVPMQGNFSFTIDRAFPANNAINLTPPTWGFSGGGTNRAIVLGVASSFNAVSSSGREIKVDYTVTDPGAPASPTLNITSITVVK